VFIGGIARNFGANGSSYRVGQPGAPFVIEGDEYTTAPWDARPKFLHAHPTAACVTRLELDHPDVYPDLEAYRAPFRQLVAAMPGDGLLVLFADDPECAALRAGASCRVETYGTAATAEWRIVDADGTTVDELQRFSVLHPTGERI
jgi:UDP-N-acetylmuramate: L-alanyl-gamma-D-glutamyl-meso-diaminopimelate ligase